MYRGVITHNTILSILGRYKINIIVQFEYKLPSEKQQKMWNNFGSSAAIMDKLGVQAKILFTELDPRALQHITQSYAWRANSPAPIQTAQ